MNARQVLIALLLALTALFVVWFMREPIALAVFALPPFLLAIGAWLKRPTAGFWAGVFALGWFSHGVMVAYSRPGERGFALAEVVLGLALVFAGSWPGLSARFGKKKRSE